MATLLTHNNNNSLPSDEEIFEVREEARVQWKSEKLDETTIPQLESSFDQLIAFEFGRYILVNGGFNGYWSDFHANALPIEKPFVIYNESEVFLLGEMRQLKQENINLVRNLVRPALKFGNVVASLPSGLMSEVLLAADHFEGVKLYAIDIDESNFKLIREKYGDRLVDNEFHTLSIPALKLELENTFDLITSIYFVQYFDSDTDLQAFFLNVFRALKPGGHFIMNFLTPKSERSSRDLFSSERFYLFIKCQPRARWLNVWSTSKIVELLSHAGFISITLQGDTHYTFSIVNCCKPQNN